MSERSLWRGFRNGDYSTPPDMILRCRLNVPYVACIAVEMTTLDSLSNSVLVTNSATGGVDEPSTLLEVLE
jgi:hypothetical protein